MSKLNDLITRLCPDGVELKKLGEVLKICNGKDYKSFGVGDIPVYGSGGIIACIDTAIYDKPSVLIPRKGSVDKLYYVDVPFWTVDTIFFTEIYTELANPKFIYYSLQKEHLEKLNQAGGVPSLTKSVLSEVKIPVPPLEVQREIVRILDSFTELTAELKAELTARRQQYEYYRDLLLTFDDVKQVEFKKLGEIAEIRSGWGFPNKEQGVSEGDLPFYKVSDMNHPENLTYMSTAGNYVSYETAKKLGCNPAPKDTIIFPKIGVAISTNKKRMLSGIACYDNNVMGVIVGEQVLARFIYFLFDRCNLMNFSNGEGAVPSIRKSTLEKWEIPVPNLEEQERIVKILDRFDKLCNDLSEGLPAEIEARQKQYEYYRDKLLSFDKDWR